MELKDFYDALYKAHSEQFPELRFGQLVDNIQSHYKSDMFYVSNADFISKVYGYAYSWGRSAQAHDKINELFKQYKVNDATKQVDDIKAMKQQKFKVYEYEINSEVEYPDETAVFVSSGFVLADDLEDAQKRLIKEYEPKYDGCKGKIFSCKLTELDDDDIRNNVIEAKRVKEM